MSQTLSPPSSPPVTSRYDAAAFQLSTLTSLSCAPSTANTLLRSRTRTSQMRTLRSALHEAKTVDSVGDHCRSSTDDVWLANA